MNFGTLKDIFTTKLIESYSDKDSNGKELYKSFLKVLKESETLKTAFIVFKNLETKTLSSEISANEYLKESISMFDGFKGEKSLNSEIKKLTSLLENQGIEYKSLKPKTLHRDFQNLVTSPRNVGTLQKLHEARESVVTWLVSEKENISESVEEKYVRDNIDVNKFLNIATNKFNEKYKDSLTEEEKNILKVLRENNEEKIKTLVSELVKENISLVNHHLENNGDNVTIKSKLLETKDTIYKMMENNDSFNENVLKLYELKKSLKND
jgi:DNA-binding transcriptional regulator GbsR (MarR family)